MADEERILELEKRLEAVEKRLAILEEYRKNDIMDDLQDKENMERMQDEIDFIDEKIEKQLE